MKNLIFVVVNGNGFRAFANVLKENLDSNVLVDDTTLGPHVYDTFKDVGTKKSLFFSQVLFYGSLPSRRNIIVSTPKLSVRTLLQL